MLSHKFLSPFVCAVVALLVLINAHAAPLDYRVETVAQGFEKPWALTAIPGEAPVQQWWVTERTGNLITLDLTGQFQRKSLALSDLYVKGQGGLLDIKPAQDFADSGQVLLSFSTGVDEHNTLRVIRATFSGAGLRDLHEVLTVTPWRETPVHYGGRLLPLADGTWLLSSGDGFDYREQAQVDDSMLGKVLRFNLQGQPVESNPFFNASAPSQRYVYTLGHRNPQGLSKEPNSERIWLHEHGPAGGDEINLIQAGNNYGWPLLTEGKDYSGANITPFEEYPGMTSPVVNWTPSIAPSSMVWYQGRAFPGLRGKLLVGSLAAQAVYAVDLSTQPAQVEEIFATIKQRIRDINVTPEGHVLLLTDGDNARLLKILPR